MITLRDHHTGDLFDRWAFLGPKRRELLEGTWAGVFRQHLLTHLPVGELAPHFASGDGRPTKDLHVALGALILQQVHDLTDAQTVESLAFNITWHYALDLREDSDSYVCERTLRNYRRKVIDQGLDAVLFRSLTDRLLQAFGVDAGKQRLDSTALRSAMRDLTRLGCVVETISKFLRELARVYPDLHSQVNPDLMRRYVEREGPGCFSLASPSESKRRLPEAGQDLANLFLQYRSSVAQALASFQILERVLREQFELIPGGDDPGKRQLRVKEPQEIPCDNVRNPADPDSSYNAHRGQGYLAQVMETYQEDDDPARPVKRTPDLITHVAVGKMTIHDVSALEPALDDVRERGIQPDHLLGDSHYGAQENKRWAADRGIDLISPAQAPKCSKDGQLTLEDFSVDGEGFVRSCPAGHTPTSVSAGLSRLQASFDVAQCQSCPLRSRCPAPASLRRGEKSVRLQYTFERVALRKRRIEERSDAFKARYRWRAGVEGTMSRLKHQMGLGRLRVRGMPAVRYAVRIRSLGLNILRCAAEKAA